MRQSNHIIRQCIDWLRANPGPVMTDNHKVAPPSRLEMKSNMEELIHHFKLFSEGFHVPPGEAYSAVEHPKGEFGIYLVSDGANKPYRLKIRAAGFPHLQALDEMARATYRRRRHHHRHADIVFGDRPMSAANDAPPQRSPPRCAGSIAGCKFPDRPLGGAALRAAARAV
jgi:NADH:ubiquinone oxidoreductase subunit D